MALPTDMHLSGYIGGRPAGGDGTSGGGGARPGGSSAMDPRPVPGMLDPSKHVGSESGRVMTPAGGLLRTSTGSR
jgi:hypothetical protein